MLQEFLKYLHEQSDLHSIYLWGGQGELLTEIDEAYIRRKETSTANANRVIALWKDRKDSPGARAFDCSGLGMYYLYNLHRLLPSDMTANTMKTQCNRLRRNELRKGDWVFRCYSNGKAYHIGYIIDDTLNVIEAKGRNDGVVKRALDADGIGYWNAYGRPEIFKDEIEKEAKESGGKIMIELTELRKGRKGAQVKTVQRILKALGYSVGGAGVDGDFGKNTEKAVKAFQADRGIASDGIVGMNTWTKLLKG